MEQHRLNSKQLSAFEAMEEAQKIAFAPMIFQATRSLINSGLLSYIWDADGLDRKSIYSKSAVSKYATDLLLEVGLSIKALYVDGEKIKLSKLGYFLCSDDMTRVNINFVNDVCYEGLLQLEKSLHSGKPEGLKVFGTWETIYEGLTKLPEKTRDSWLKFDHFYSDQAFEEALPFVFKNKPRSILDIGGNTGRFASLCLDYCQQVVLSILDLSGQIELMKHETNRNRYRGRLSAIEMNILEEERPIPGTFDVIWMSQFLDCFSIPQIVQILKKCAQAVDRQSSIFILEPLVDRQKFRASADSLTMTSLYFTCMANGNSKMYHLDDLIYCIEEAGLTLASPAQELGHCHTLLECRLK